MANTLSDLAKEVARELNMLDANGELSAEDDAYIKGVIQPEVAALPADGVNVYWDNDDIPDEVYRPLIRFLSTCLPAFGIVAADQDREVRLARLIRAAASPYVGTTLKSEYF